MEFLVAFASDNGNHFINRHFGDAKQYLLFKISPYSIEQVGTITNSTPPEQQHADPQKAKNIVELLKERKIQIVVSKNFGPNIQRIKQFFVCVRTKDSTIKNATLTIQKHLQLINTEWNVGKERNFLNL